MTWFYTPKGDVPLLGFAPFAAYSVRTLVPTYFGPTMQVKRSSDNSIANLYTNENAVFTAVAI